MIFVFVLIEKPPAAGILNYTFIGGIEVKLIEFM
jgi:hypothetical protein